MTGGTSRIRKFILFFLKICTFLKNYDFVKDILGKKIIFFYHFHIFDGSMGCAIKFHADKISSFLSISARSKCKVVDMCGVEGKRRLCDLNVTSSSPALATRHIPCVLLVNSPNKLNLLSWLLIYLCNK